ncbi:hypothetical protein [Kitasatospora sp. MBT63]|uniref:hypothetical protein n=1 Tax=Kitasatospora sp. MBT63 TaxID=1444768 RepID=UPI0005396088|nr:hypothetical protein [Kitasatospora sp. MBT63]
MGMQALPREYRVEARKATVVISAAGLSVFVLLQPLWASGSIAGWVKLLAGSSLLVLFGKLLVSVRGYRTTVDVKGIHVRAGRTRTLGWREVQDIRASPNPSADLCPNSPRTIVYAYDSRGGRLQLMHVDDRNVDVDREVAIIRAAWVELRGDDWVPRAEVWQRIRSNDRREARTFRWMVLLATPVVLGLLLWWAALRITR